MAAKRKRHTEHAGMPEGDKPIDEQVPESPFVLVALSYPIVLLFGLLALAVSLWLIW